MVAQGKSPIKKVFLEKTAVARNVAVETSLRNYPGQTMDCTLWSGNRYCKSSSFTSMGFTLTQLLPNLRLNIYPSCPLVYSRLLFNFWSFHINASPDSQSYFHDLLPYQWRRPCNSKHCVGAFIFDKNTR